MNACPRNLARSLVLTSVSLVLCAPGMLGRQPVRRQAQPNTAPSASQTQSPTPPDAGAQIDQLIKQCNEQLNVKGQFKDAEETAKQAFDLSQKLGDKKRIIVALLYLGSAYYIEGLRSQALEAFKQTEALARETGNRKALSRALNNMAGVLGDLGRYEESLSYLYQCMDVARELGDEPMQYTVLINIGELYIRLGDPGKAESPLLESLRMARTLKHSDMVSDPSKVATEASLQLLGEMEVARGNYQSALKYLQQVRDSHPDNSQKTIDLLNTMAVIHQRLGESQKAANLLQEAISVAEKASANATYPILLGNLGEAQESLGQMDEALASEGRALTALRQAGGSSDFEWPIQRRLGHIERAVGHRDEALTHYMKAVDEIERLRTVTLNTELGQASFAGRSSAVYEETADLLYDMQRAREALEVAERGRARAFLDMLAEAHMGLADELTADQRKREDAISARISALQKGLWKEGISPDDEKKGKTELSAAEDELETFRLEVRRSNPRYASVRYPEPLSVSQIQNELLDDHTALVEYLLGEKRSLVWLVTRDKITAAVLPPRREIEEQVFAFRKSITQRTSSLTLQPALAESNELGQKLYYSLLKAIARDFVAKRTLIFIPDGALGYLPFEALVTDSSGGGHPAQPVYFAEKFTVVYGPSASALVTLQGLHPPGAATPKALLALGDPVVASGAASASTTKKADATRLAPDTAQPTTEAPLPALPSPADDYAERGFSFVRLPYTRDEVLAISRLFPVEERKVYLGEAASEEAVKAEKLDQYRYIHFASHGFIDEAQPSRSGILLSRDPHSAEDGVLQMGEIMRLLMNADLVTLSACSTGLGKLVSGEGILGLTRAFFYAGARNVTVSLWNVNDSATAELMKHFYQNLNRGVPKSEALRQAKLSLLHGPNAAWRQPYFWGAFILVGQGN